MKPGENSRRKPLLSEKASYLRKPHLHGVDLENEGTVNEVDLSTPCLLSQMYSFQYRLVAMYH